MLGDVEMFSAIFGWLVFSVLIMVILVIIFETVGSSFFNDLSKEVQVIISLILGYCFWYPYWDQRNRG